MDVDRFTDKELEKLEKRIAREYSTAYNELRVKYDNYYNGYDDADGVHHKGLTERYEQEFKAFERGAYHDESGVYTDQQMFDRWLLAQEGRGEHIKQMYSDMAERLAQSSEVVQTWVNGDLPRIYTLNNNAVATLAQESAMAEGRTGLRFDLVDEHTVKRLMAGSREVRPYKPVAIDLPKLNNWNYSKLQNALLQGILQGDRIDKIADRFEAVVGMNRASAIRNARTAYTGAQSAGKQDRYEDLAKQGCISYKVWKAVEDDRTRPEHSDADGQEVRYDEPFDVGGEELMYPADPSASGWNIYNCRCTTGVGKFRFESVLSDEKRTSTNIHHDDNEDSNKENIEIQPHIEQKQEETTASRLDDAIDSLNSKGVKVDLTEIGNPSEKVIGCVEAINDLTDEYRNTAIGFSVIKGNGMIDAEGGYALMINHQTGIVVKTTSMRNVADVYNIPREKAFLSTTYHEFAHSLSQKVGKKPHELYDEEKAFWKEIGKVFSEYKKESRIGTDAYISSYSIKNVDEFMCESFAQAKLSDKPSIYAEKVLEIIDKYFKK